MGGIEAFELRSHGIANSPPADMLRTSNEKVDRKDGDEQGSFWQVTPTSIQARGELAFMLRKQSDMLRRERLRTAANGGHLDGQPDAAAMEDAR